LIELLNSEFLFTIVTNDTPFPQRPVQLAYFSQYSRFTLPNSSENSQIIYSIRAQANGLSLLGIYKKFLHDTRRKVSKAYRPVSRGVDVVI